MSTRRKRRPRAVRFRCEGEKGRKVRVRGVEYTIWTRCKAAGRNLVAVSATEDARLCNVCRAPFVIEP